MWQYDDSAHKKFIDAVVADENSTEKQIQIIAEELANRGNIDEKSKKLLALSVESVILERMGFSTENATRKLARISFKEHDIPKVLEETQKTARIFLDAMQKSVNRKSTKNLDVPENNPLLEKIGVIKSASKIEQTPPEQELNLTDEPVQRGLFDTVTEKQVDNSVETDSATLEENMENIPSDEIPTIDDKNLIAGNEVTNEEISPSNDDSAEISDSEVIDAEFIEQNTNEISDVENNSTSVDEVVTEENPLPDNDAKIIEENSVPETSGEIIDVPTDEQNNSDYDFEEFDEEEEILPDDSEKQPKVEILPEDNQHSETEIDNLEENISPENNSEQIQTVEANVKPDLQTVLAEDMAVIRGNSREKNVFRNNVTAIRTLQQIESEKRAATSEEIEILKNYSGFSGIPKAFDKNDPNWNREAWLLQSMLTDKEYNDARGSTLNAHYTSAEIVQGMYGGLKNLGFNQGTILEPSMGVGGFFGNMPDEIKTGSHLFGVELDSLTGRIAQKIYPDAEISIQGFEDTRYLNNSFDLAVGNVPFGNYRVNDKGYNQNHFLIHDYFIAKMIDQVRPGGLVAIITSRGTFDKQYKAQENIFRNTENIFLIFRNTINIMEKILKFCEKWR